MFMRSTPFIEDTLGPHQQESITVGVQFSQMSVIQFFLRFSCCPYYWGVCYNGVSARPQLTVFCSCLWINTVTIIGDKFTNEQKILEEICLEQACVFVSNFSTKRNVVTIQSQRRQSPAWFTELSRDSVIEYGYIGWQARLISSCSEIGTNIWSQQLKYKVAFKAVQ